MKVTRFTGGPMPTNCYMLTDESTGATAVIDPGFVNESLLKAVEGADVQAILLTHGHWDPYCRRGRNSKTDWREAVY